MRCENVAGAREDVAVAFQAQQKKPATQACGREIAALHGGKESLKMPRNLLPVEGKEEDERATTPEAIVPRHDYKYH